MQHYVIKFVSDLQFSPGTPVSSINKTDHHDINEILLKVALSTINRLNQPFLNLSVLICYYKDALTIQKKS